MSDETKKSYARCARRSVAVTGMLLVSFTCGCQSGGGSRVTVLLGARTLDPNERLTPVPVRATRGSEYCERGVDYFRRGDYGRAADAFDRASEMNPDDHNSVFLAGLAYEKLGDQSSACKRYGRAAKIEYRSEYLDGEGRACRKNDRR